MKRTIVLVAALLLASVLPAASQEPDKTALLLQRVAAQSGGRVDVVVVGKLPSGMPSVPLPDATIVGGVRRTFGLSSNPLYSYDLFYEAAPETFKAYVTALTAAGWALQSQFGGGFTRSGSAISRVFCRTGAPLVIVHEGPSPEDLDVTLSTRMDESDAMCSSSQPNAVASPIQTSVPNLYAPQGATLDTSGFNFSLDAGESSARISKGSSANALLDNFASQMTAAGWQAGSKLNSTGVASQTFTKLDNPKYRLQSVILVTAIDGQPGNFVAILDVEHL